MIRRPPRSPLFPYTPLFRSHLDFVVDPPPAAVQPRLEGGQLLATLIAEPVVDRLARGDEHRVEAGVLVRPHADGVPNDVVPDAAAAVGRAAVAVDELHRVPPVSR